MLLLKIYNVNKNDNEKPLCTLHHGEHVIGRGFFSNCMDKNISRRHVIIHVQDDGVFLKLVHITPIFYMCSNTPHIQILKKDESIKLLDGDKFAFLMDTWYSVKIENDEMAGNSSAVENSNASTAEICDTKVFQSESKKRWSTDSDSSEPKKLKLDNDSVCSNSDNLISKVDSFNNNNDLKIPEDSTSKETTQVFKKEVLSDSDDDSDVELLPEVTRDTEIVSGAERKPEVKSEPSENVVEQNNSDILDNIKKEPMIEDDANPVVKTEAIDVKEESNDDVEGTKKSVQNSGNSDCHTGDIGATSSAEANRTGSEQVQNTSAGEPAQNTSGGEPAQSTNDGEPARDLPEASPSSSGACVDNAATRQRCFFGETCYRRNTVHRNHFSHPGDSDYDQIRVYPKGLCPYGARCYMQNPKHREDYRHPTACPAPKPPTSKRRTTIGNPFLIGWIEEVNMRLKMLNDLDSEDDSDSDPFGTDRSSSASEIFGDDGSDDSEEPDFNEDEEFKMLSREAKTFQKRNR